MRLSLEREADIEERGQGLDRNTVLCMVQEVSLATLVLRIPLEDIELRVTASLLRALPAGACQPSKGALRELLMWIWIHIHFAPRLSDKINPGKTHSSVTKRVTSVSRLPVRTKLDRNYDRSDGCEREDEVTETCR